ncbi:hypothetical protein [Synechococcus phage S-N03]|uniref:Uncharacterized protein n=1 Tax=Synechococcus phage S-N03 TaxID=2718943 RepID=A0A6G8R5Y7_9CAUD|nr:hypothetical protein PQC09_gp180 [Synechococcus phage S-N03]QIN96815.1 hypothetical protein [Synechococcus phage S-N03]
MTTKLRRKFEEHLESLEAAAYSEIDLRDNYKLYNKLQRFYTKQGVTFTGDTETDYNMVVNYLYEDLFADY